MTRHTITPLAVAFALFAPAAWAVDFETADVDDNGIVDEEEFAAVFPDTDPETFPQVDANDDTLIVPSEWETAANIDLIPGS